MNKNPNLPANALPATDVVAGMYLVHGAYVMRVESVLWNGFNGIIKGDGMTKRVNRAGTVRLAPAMD